MNTHTFESLLAALGQGGVEFILVGGLAVAFSGYPRATLAAILELPLTWTLW